MIPRLMDEKSAMKLVFGTLIRVSERWSRVSISQLENKRRKLLRRELGIDPPPDEQRRKPRPEVKRSSSVRVVGPPHVYRGRKT